jgi:hypothetical protein
VTRALLALLIVSAFSTPQALAHERSASHSTWTVGSDSVRVTLTIAARDAASGMLGVDTARADASAIREQLVTQLRASTAAGTCAPNRSTFRALPAVSGHMSWGWTVRCTAPQASLTIESHLFEHEAPHHMHVARVRGAGISIDRILSGAERATTITLGHAEPMSFDRALRLGVEHLASGADHLMFLLMLVVASLNLRALGIAITGFTLGHSATLALGALGWLHPSTRLIEALIGLSIVVVSVERLWLSPDAAHASRLRASLAAGFGLVHGLGFAGALADASLAPEQLLPTLLGFNIGIEVAQLMIAALAWTVLATIRRHSPSVGIVIAELASATACGAGVYWTITRLG